MSIGVLSRQMLEAASLALSQTSGVLPACESICFPAVYYMLNLLLLTEGDFEARIMSNASSIHLMHDPLCQGRVEGQEGRLICVMSANSP